MDVLPEIGNASDVTTTPGGSLGMFVENALFLK